LKLITAAYRSATRRFFHRLSPLVQGRVTQRLSSALAPDQHEFGWRRRQRNPCMPGLGMLPKPYTNRKVPAGVVPSPSWREAEKPL
jgi:hypothetical protein